MKSERSCIFVFGLSILPLSVILLFDFGADPILLYFRFLMNGGVNILYRIMKNSLYSHGKYIYGTVVHSH
jgi:hypothetical protein